MSDTSEGVTEPWKLLSISTDSATELIVPVSAKTSIRIMVRNIVIFDKTIKIL